MTTRIETFEFPTRFDDRMTRGLLRRFEHVYRFRPLGDAVVARCRTSWWSKRRSVRWAGGWNASTSRAVWTRYLVRSRLEHIKRVAEGDEWQRYATSDRDTLPLAPPSAEVARGLGPVGKIGTRKPLCSNRVETTRRLLRMSSVSVRMKNAAASSIQTVCGQTERRAPRGP